LASGVVKSQQVSPAKLELARTFRRKMTRAETIVWERVRRCQLGVKIRRQQIIEGFIVDFYCEKAGLVIEVDGPVHTIPERVAIDVHREKVFAEKGLTELRFTNQQVYNDIDAVMSKITACISRRIRENVNAIEDTLT
jgi:very-short-patch-repair endonuclease